MGGANGLGGAGGATAATSMGCGKTPTLKSGALTIQSGGASRKYMLRLPDNYDNKQPYRLMIGFHGATGNATEVAGAQNNGYFGLYALSAGSTIFVATEAVGGIWATSDLSYVNDVLDQVERELCIDTDRIGLEGFSQGAAMVWTVACSRSKTFRFAIGHSGGGLANPTTCEPIAYLGSLGLQESTGGGGQTTQTDKFAKWAGCTIETLPKAPTGGHLCSDYQGCSAGHPVRWCQYDGGHTPSPTDAGQGSSWMPKEAWKFVAQF
jgi:poly(3-hydroxybutyrate) depolymerase